MAEEVSTFTESLENLIKNSKQYDELAPSIIKNVIEDQERYRRASFDISSTAAYL
jgi:hypothetical protein